MPSIQQVANACGVSTATVSKVINGRAGVNALTAQRVRQMMDEMDFIPQSKATDQNRILVALPNHRQILLHPYPATILAGIVEAACKQGVSLSLKASPDTPPTSEELRQMVREDGSRGVILIAARASYEWADRLVIEKLPHVVVGSTQHDLDVNQVIMDDQNSATRAVDYLAELGHRDIQIVTFKRDDVVHAARYAGYTQAMSRLMPPDQIPCGLEVETATIATGEIIMHELWALPKHPTAVIVTNETLAVGLVHEARRMGINVPGQLSILAYESQTFLASADPAITAMVSPAFEMGQQAFAMIQRQIQTTPPQDKSARMTVTTSQMHHRLIVRQSTVGPCQM